MPLTRHPNDKNLFLDQILLRDSHRNKVPERVDALGQIPACAGMTLGLYCLADPLAPLIQQGACNALRRFSLLGIAVMGGMSLK
jgi:hypothetical protein